ncbi:putative exported protein [Rubellimicrobium mesophilum DSM 19309]|uniref:Putative exported protein n=1 Tax=Rubellimicrobium mesophilum DSM 19309 TaxID=442562 RepID=A0A017HVI5_9RHOB|nr:tripartite tricarboxylate transporter substrate binding protein [Rubellimicrobium mesophilum]EYD78396.1 putative exported protein [Rubellimicrobium mesophilum DSM 19309]
MIRFTRRAFGALVGTTLLASPVLAQDGFPDRPITIIVPYAPGGQGDITGRLIADHLSPLIGQPVTVENRPAANGVIGISEIANAEPDGYTLGVVVASHAMSRALVPDLPYDPVTSFTPITTTALTEMVMVVPPTVEANTVEEFIAYAKEHPGEMAYKSAGQGSNSHLFSAWFADAAGLDMIHIPYQGSGDSMPDFLAGVTQLGFDTVPAVRGYIDNGQLKALAAGGPEHSAAYPDLPTVAEAGVPGFAANSWGMVVAPAGLPEDVLKFLNENIVAALQEPAVVEQFATMGAQVVANTPEEAKAMLESEETKYSELISSLGITLSE